MNQLPKPYCKNTANIKAFVLGCDPTAFDNNGNRLEFETVFNIGGKDERYFSGILKNLEIVGLSLDDIYVQNVVTYYQEKETMKNMDWMSIAKGYIQPRIDEFNLIDPSKEIPVFLTAERLYRILLNDDINPSSAKEIYQNCLIPIETSQNKLGRPLIPLYRHQAYNLTNWENYTENVCNILQTEANPPLEEHDFFKSKENVLRFAKKPAKCPKCGSSKIVWYVYGMPVWDEKQQQQVRDGKIVLGGCCVGIDDPFCVCIECKTDFYKPLPESGFPVVEIKGNYT